MTDSEIEQDINEKSWSCLSIHDAAPPFMYTVGLVKTFRHAELIIFGLERSVAWGALSALVAELRSGKSLTANGTFKWEAGGLLLGFRDVHATQHPLYLGYAMGFCRNNSLGELTALQVFWADQRQRFPFHAGCDIEVYQLQPRLDVSLTPSEMRQWKRQWE